MDDKSIRAIIIAGGLGSRLGSLTSQIPKPLLPIAGKPLLAHQLDLLLQHDLKHIYISAGYKSPLIKQYIDSVPTYKKYTTIIEDSWKAGSGGCLQFMPPWDSSSLVLFGDIAIDMNIKAFIDFHTRNKADTSLALQINDHPLESDLIQINEENKCIEIYCKPHHSTTNLVGYMVGGVFILESLILKDISSEKPMELVRDLIKPAIKSNKRIFGYLTNEYMDDIGEPHRYKRINKEWVLKTTMKSFPNTLIISK